jgi:hypothetical protein
MLAEDPPVPYTQISAKLGIPAGSIGPRRGRCLDKLRRDPAIAVDKPRSRVRGKRAAITAGNGAAMTISQ